MGKYYHYYFYIPEFFSPSSACPQWLLWGHMTSNYKTVSRQKSLSGQQCKIYDVRGYSALLPANVNRWPPLLLYIYEVRVTDEEWSEPCTFKCTIWAIFSYLLSTEEFRWLQWESNQWPLRYPCNSLPTELWIHSGGSRSIYWAHVFPSSNLL